MSEVDFELLLDAVRTAVAPDIEEEFMLGSLPLGRSMPRAANDNDLADWPLIPFPDGWHSVC